MPKPNRPELAVLRGKSSPESLTQWTEAFAQGDPDVAKRYADLIARFTGRKEGSEYEAYIGTYSPATRRAYAHALTEFFEWIASKYGRIVPPPQVTRKDAEDYVQWLTARPYSLEAEKLRDGDQRERLALYEIVRELGSADLSSIVGKAPTWLKDAHPSPGRESIDKEWLSQQLGRMVLHDLLVRSPTIDELRKEDKRIGISVFTVLIPDGNGTREIELQDVYQYTLPQPKPVSRSTISVRLAALTAFWNALAEGENAGGGGELLRFNIFSGVSARVRKGLAADNRAAAARKGRLTPEIVERMLRASDGPSLTEKRDAAVLWFLVLTGCRLTEAARLRRDRPPTTADVHRWPGWYDGRANPPVVELVRKGGLHQRLPFPPYALKALNAFQAELSRYAPLSGTQSEDPARPHYLSPTAPGWRYKALAEEADAPLFPPVSFWGANSSHNYQEFKPNANLRPDYRRSMSRHGVDAILKRIAKKAELSEEEIARVHVHAFRHFAATAMSKQGKPIREIQHILGHDSVTTTERYVEAETRPEALSGQNEILDYISSGAVREPLVPPEPSVPRQPPSRKVIETYSVTPPQRPARPERPAPEHVKKRRESIARAEHGVLPAQAPRLVETVIAPAEGRLVALAAETDTPAGVEIRNNVSPPSPIHAYAGHADSGTEAQTEAQRVAQQERIQFTIVNVRQSRDASLANLADPGAQIQKGNSVVVIATGKKGTVLKVFAPPVGTSGIGVAPKQEDEDEESFVENKTERMALVRVGTTEMEMPLSAVKRDLVQQNPWLRKNYDPWPIGYGLGEGSLLPWFAVGSASANGEVKVTLRNGTTVHVPPLPVLSPAQMDPGLAPQRAALLWNAVDDMRKRFLASEPTRAFGLDRWWGTFLTILQGLQRNISGKFTWMPFDMPVALGKQIRAHEDSYIATWLEENSNRFTATINAFEDVARLRGVSDESEIQPEEWDNFTKAWRSASIVGASPAEELPDWFIVDDPVHDIFEKNPEEWEWFSKWIGVVTGQKLTPERKKDLKVEVDFEKAELSARINKARGTLESYYSTVTEITKAPSAERTRLRQMLKLITEELAKLGVPDPKKMLEDGTLKKRQSRAANIGTLLGIAFPGAGVTEVDPNVLRSPLFDADSLKLDMKNKTISHTDSFRRDFAERYDDRDSECVMRRAARGMWEHVKRHGIPIARGSERSSEYSLIYSVMLSYAAWIYPCPVEIEQRMAAQFANGEEARLEWLKGVRRTSQMVHRTTRDLTEEAILRVASENHLDRKSAGDVIKDALVSSAVQAGEALPSPETTARVVEEAIQEGTVISTGARGVFIRADVVRRRGAPQLRRNPANMTLAAFAAGSGYIANAEEALPSSIRMMAAMTIRFS